MSSWTKSVDIDRARRNCHQDILGDWHRDPWGWPELDWVADEANDFLVDRLRRDGACVAERISVAKENFGIRPAVVVDPIDRLAYQCLVDLKSLELIGGMADWIFGWRLFAKNPERGRYSKNNFQWENYRRRLRKLSGLYQLALTTDVTSFFASVPVESACERVLQQCRGGASTERLCSMLRAWDNVPGRSGLPQRSSASAALANMYLSPLELTVRQAIGPMSGEESPAAARWMDDIWVFGAKASKLRATQIDLQQAMSDLGLNMNLAKTDLIRGGKLLERVGQLELSYVDVKLAEPEPDLDPLEELVIRVTADRPRTPRTLISFLCNRLRKHKLWRYVERLVERCEEMPQGADHLARLFLASGRSTDLETWYQNYWRSDWGKIDWAVSSFGRMFSTRRAPEAGLRTHFAEFLAGGSGSYSLLSLAAHRMASWDERSAKAAIRAGINIGWKSPAERRVLALSLVAANDERRFVRKLLSEHPENEVTLRMLESRSFVPVPTKPEFPGK